MDTGGFCTYKKIPEAEDWLLKAARGSNDAEVLEHYGDALYKMVNAMRPLNYGARKEMPEAKSEALDKAKNQKLDD